MNCVDVAINLPVKNLFKQFTYLVPDSMSFLDCGWRVVVPFGQQKVEGFVVGKNNSPAELELKEIEAVVGDRPWFDTEMLATARWLSMYYMCSLAEAMRLFIPGKSSIKRKAVKDENGRFLYYAYEERLKEKFILAYKINTFGKNALNSDVKITKTQQYALQVLHQQQEWLSVKELAELKISSGIVKKLLENGWIESCQKRILRNSYQCNFEEAEKLTLTDEQKLALDNIYQALDKKEHTDFLLQGITGSGKTEIYLRSAQKVVAEGRQVLILVPEIALTAQLVKRFQRWFGDNVAVVHSKLSQNERGDVWYKMRTGEAQILIGVRSAVFAPFYDLGLVIIDEEHESSYKQEERPNYHAREVALERCKNCGAVLILGSATPDLETYYKTLQGEYVHLRLTKRANGSNLPQTEIVDMRQELQARNFSVLSRKLRQALINTAAEGEQSIVLLNRRGYSTFVLCRDCGQSVMCPHCAVAMVYHSADNVLRCHYCGNQLPIPQNCPVCDSKKIKYFGTGTQKAEEEIMALPEVRVLRMDQDSTMAKFAHADILHKFLQGERNVLIGTQMVAKGHDIPNVTLVGVLLADSSLNLPDYRASERTFSLLTQAAGRAGRGSKEGHVIFQAYDAENEIISLAAKQDYDTFARKELQDRQELLYPPFVQMLKLTVWDENEERGLTLAKQAVNFLQSKILDDTLKDTFILGPFPAIVAKVRDMYRFNIVIKAQNIQPVKDLLLSSEFKEQKNLYFDVDPLSVI